MNLSPLELQIKVLPGTPGVYQYFDKEDRILYIGKAKNLKKRVSSYFTKTHSSGRLRVLVKKIAVIKHIVVPTESDALLLENSLIKKFQPRYNIMLKDDKTYPWICIKNERFPRIFPTRRKINDGSQYFGPYTSGKYMKTLLSLFRELYPLRTCNYDLSKENIAKGKFKVCLEFHLKNCHGPCEGLEQQSDYDEYIQSVTQILKGNYSAVIKRFKEKMNTYAQEMEFEKAQAAKLKIEALENYQTKSTVVNPKITNVDVT